MNYLPFSSGLGSAAVFTKARLRGRLLPLALAAFYASCAAGGASEGPAVKNHAQDRTAAGERICLSLRALLTLASDSQATGHPLPPEARTLGGFSWPEGYLVDRAHRDIVLVGRIRPNGLTLDDLVVHLRNTNCEDATQAPYCSLDPRPEDIRNINRVLASDACQSIEEMRRKFLRIREAVGPQMVVLGGSNVPHESNLSAVMLLADYKMKMVSQSHLVIPGLPSMLDLTIAEAEAAARAGKSPEAGGVSLSRFWFHIRAGHPKFAESGQMVRLNECSVVVLTEHQLAAQDGSLSDGGTKDPLAQKWARLFSERLDSALDQVPEFGELVRHFRLSALLRAMAYRHAAQTAGVDLGGLLSSYRYRMGREIPPSLPGLANFAERSFEVKEPDGTYRLSLMPMVCGGVSMAINLRASDFAQNSALDAEARAYLQARPAPTAFCWKVAL